MKYRKLKKILKRNPGSYLEIKSQFGSLCLKPQDNIGRLQLEESPSINHNGIKDYVKSSIPKTLVIGVSLTDPLDKRNRKAELKIKWNF